MNTNSVKELSDAVLRGVVKSGVLSTADNALIDKACEITRAEIKAFLFGEAYAEERECLALRSIHEGYVVALIVAECVLKIKGSQS